MDSPRLLRPGQALQDSKQGFLGGGPVHGVVVALAFVDHDLAAVHSAGRMVKFKVESFQERGSQASIWGTVAGDQAFGLQDWHYLIPGIVQHNQRSMTTRNVRPTLEAQQASKRRSTQQAVYLSEGAVLLAAIADPD